MVAPGGGKVSIYTYSQYLRSGITFQQRTAPGVFATAIAITKGLALPEGSMEQDPSWGKYLIRKRSFGLPPEYLGGIIPRPGDQINYKGVTWQISDGGVSQPKASGVFRCTCNILFFNLLMKDSLTWIRATAVASMTGSRTVTDTVTGSSIAGAVEPRDQLVQDLFGSKATPEVFDIYLDSDPSEGLPSSVKAGDMLQDQNNVRYEITEVVKRERLDAKPQYIAVKKL